MILFSKSALSAVAHLRGTGDDLLDPRQMGRQRLTSRMNALPGAFGLPVGLFFRFGQKRRFLLHLRLFDRGLAFHQLQLPVAQLLARRPEMLDPKEPQFKFKKANPLQGIHQFPAQCLDPGSGGVGFWRWNLWIGRHGHVSLYVNV